MTDLGMQFVLAARRMKLVEETTEPVIHEVQSSYMKFCSFCFEMMPHIRKEDHSECTVCGLQTFPKRNESGQALVEIAICIALVAFVLLVVLKDHPW